MVWVGHKSGIFSVKSACALVVNLVAGDNSFPQKKIWSMKWPMKHGFFLWQAVLNRLPTLTNLQKRGSAFINPNGSPIANSCIFCGTRAEDNDHLFLHCSFASRIWSFFQNGARRVVLTPHQSVLDVISNWNTAGLTPLGKEIWKRIPTSIMWNLWIERNKRTFNGQSLQFSSIIATIKIQTFYRRLWNRVSRAFILMK